MRFVVLETVASVFCCLLILDICEHRAGGRDNVKTGVLVKHRLVIGIDVIYVAEVCRMCAVLRNKIGIRFDLFRARSVPRARVTVGVGLGLG